jgi:hypothetical protein
LYQSMVEKDLTLQLIITKNLKLRKTKT